MDNLEALSAPELEALIQQKADQINAIREDLKVIRAELDRKLLAEKNPAQE